MKIVMFILLNLGMHQAFSQQNFLSASKPNSIGVSNNETVFTITDKMATFPGGPSGWDKYVHKNLDYSIPIKNNAPSGRYNVIVSFIINEKGMITDLKSLTSHGFGLEEEVLRVVAKGPRWKPAIQKGKPVKSFRKQPLTFVVNNKIK